MKKNLQLTAMAFALSFAIGTAQNSKVASKNPPVVGPQDQNPPTHFPNRGCATQVPSAEWDNWFNQKVEEFKAKNMENGKAQMANYTIPVIIHVIHTGQAAGTFPNLAQGQLNSQITVLNQDYAGTGYNVGNYPAAAFSNYATAANLPAANKDGAGRVKISNTNIQFCLATKNPTGGVLAEPGIERINATSITAALSGTFTSKDPANAAYNNPNKFMAFIDGYIKPNTIWDPTRYLNVWVTNEQGTVGLLGYATFPTGTGLTGISGNGTATTDGFWAYARAFGSNLIFPGGTYDAIYNKGRTCTHEIGHWLGLRHIWGDMGQCGATDYCVDTPPQRGTTGPPAGCYYGSPTYPSQANTCTRPDGIANANVTNVNGDMFMNFMDYTDDPAMYMFTEDQRTRMQTAMANGTFRNQLTASAATLCTLPPAAPVTSIAIAATGCASAAITTTNTTSGNPTPTYVWSTSPATGVTYNPNNTATNPSITFNNAGTYTVTCAATNSLGTNNNSKVITITTCSVPPASCNDTLTNFKNTDTLFLIRSGSTSPGYVGGNNGYGDKAKAEWYSSVGLAPNSKVIGGIVLFYRHATANIGTKGTSNIVMSVYNGNNTTGPAGAATANHTVAINTILASATATSGVTYCGDPTLAFSSNIIRPYSFNFTTPATIAGDFILATTLPSLTGDTVAIFTTSGNTATGSTAWEMWSDNSWNKFNDGTTNSWQLNSSIAILPKISCNVGAINYNGISANIALFPNPSNGKFNFAVTMPQASDLYFTVINNIGQVVHTKTETGITNAIIGMDLSHLAKGVYFVNITDSNGDKTTKKLIIE